MTHVACASQLASNALQLINAVRSEIREPLLAQLPRGSIRLANAECPIAKALTAIILPEERRIVFCYPWHASAANKIWRASFTDALLMSVNMPDVIYNFATAFRRGLYPDLLE